MVNTGLMAPVPTRGQTPDPTTGLAGVRAGQQVIANPTFSSDAPPNAQEVGYKDEYGRTGVSRGDPSTGVVQRGPRVTIGTAGGPPGAVKPTPSTTNINNPAGPTPPKPPRTNDAIRPQPEIGGIKLSTIGTLLGVGSVALGMHGMATAGIMNTGAFAGLNNAIDAGGEALGGFQGTSGLVFDNAGNGYYAVQGANGVDLVPATSGGQIPLSNAVGWGMAGGAIADLIGLGSRNALVNTGASIVGGVAGGAIGGQIGGAVAGVAAGTIGAFTGGFALVVLAGLLQGKPSSKMASGQFDPNSGQLISESLQGNKYSKENNEYRDKYFGIIQSLQQDMVKNYGGTFEGINTINVDVGQGLGPASSKQTGITVSIGDKTVQGGATNTRQFGEDAVGSIEWIGKESVRLMQNLQGDLAIAQRNIDYNQPLGAVLGDMNFARDFAQTSQAMINGTLVIDMPNAEGIQSVNLWAQRAQRLGLNQDLINRAVQTATANINSRTPQNST